MRDAPRWMLGTLVFSAALYVAVESPDRFVHDAGLPVLAVIGWLLLGLVLVARGGWVPTTAILINAPLVLLILVHVVGTAFLGWSLGWRGVDLDAWLWGGFVLGGLVAGYGFVCLLGDRGASRARVRAEAAGAPSSPWDRRPARFFPLGATVGLAMLLSALWGGW